jgi:NADH:ubiquinone oxidoreductase subunit 6 (subunit J)
MPLIGARWEDILFITLAATLLGSALLVVTMRDIIRCGLALTVSFASLAGIYALLRNPLIAATQVLVYIGAVSVLILFAIMLTEKKNAPTRLVFQTQAAVAAVAAGIIAVGITAVVLATSWSAAAQRIATHTADVARLLFKSYVLPFEVVSVLLTAAVVGAIYLARREPAGKEEDR